MENFLKIVKIPKKNICVYHICGIVYHICGSKLPDMWYTIPQTWYTIPQSWIPRKSLYITFTYQTLKLTWLPCCTSFDHTQGPTLIWLCFDYIWCFHMMTTCPQDKNCSETPLYPKPQLSISLFNKFKIIYQQFAQTKKYFHFIQLAIQ